MISTAQNARNSDLTPMPSPTTQTVLLTDISRSETGSLTGTEPSGHGLETLRNLAKTNLNAREINWEITASLKQDFGSRLVIKELFDKGFETVIGHNILLTGASDESWIKALEYYTKPSRGDVTAMEVTRLRSLTAKRKEGEFDLELSIGALTEELCVYPEDIVRTVCRDWARNNKFFPVLKELMDECEKLFDLRYSVLDVMRKAKISDVKPLAIGKAPEIKEEVNVSSLVEQCIRNLSAG